MQDSKRISIIFDSLRFPLICLVIMIHVIPTKVYPVTESLDALNFYRFVSELISHIWGAAAVPTFFVVSGYFAFVKGKDWLNTQCFIDELRKKGKGLLLPYLFWNISFVLLSLIRESALTKSLECLSSYTLEKLFQDLWISPINYPLWFLRDLITINLFLPLILFLLQRLGYRVVLVLLALYLFGFETNLVGLSMTTLLYFIGGATLSFYRLNPLDFLRQKALFVALFIIGSVVLPLINQTEYYEPLLRAYIPISVATFIITADYIYNKHRIYSYRLRELNNVVFFTYSLHALFIINWVRGIVYRLGFYNITEMLPRNPILSYPILSYPILSYLLIGVITLLVCIACYALLKRISPKLLGIVTGGRA